MSAIVKEILQFDGVIMPYAQAGEETAEKTFVILPGISVRPVYTLMEAVAGQYRVFLENGYRILLFDRRQNQPEGYTTEDMAEDTAKAMAHLGVRKADVFGASQGGMIAAALAVTHPALVDRLMLGSTCLRHNAYSDAQFRRWIELAEAKDGTGLLTESGKAMYSAATWAAYGEGFVQANAGMTEEEYGLFIRTARALLRTDLMDRASAITAGTLVLGSRGDRVFTAGPSEEIAAKLGCESFFYGTEFGHAVYDEAPDYAQRLLDFCRK